MSPPVDLAAVLADVDRVNENDPNRVDGRPRAWVEGRRATDWIDRLAPGADDAVYIAARAHHLGRWQLPRDEYPEGRAGYLRWRRDQKARHARDTAEILTAHGAPDALVERVGQLLRRSGLGQDPDTQLIEDAACLVFLEVQLDDLAERLAPDDLHRALVKSLAKMSPEAVALAAEVPMSPRGRTALEAAAGTLSEPDGS